jgi:uncharacterized protein YebE (UPF0316 family)
MGCMQILYVALNSLRVVLMIKGRKYLAACISTIEVFVYISGLALVLNNLHSPAGIVVYSITFGIGILLGIYMEQKIALGYISMQVISDNDLKMASQLREKGYGVTEWIGQGADGYRKVYLILAKRKHYAELLSLIKRIDPKAFVISSEISHVVGGFWRNKLPIDPGMGKKTL